MRASVSVVWQWVAYAWKGSLSTANNLAAVLGAAALYVVVRSGKVPDVVIPEGSQGLVFAGLICFATAWVVVFVVRMAYAPIAIVKQYSAEIVQLRAKVSLATNSANTAHIALKLTFENTEQHTRRTIYNSGGARREVFIKVENVGNGFLTDCKVSLVETLPTVEHQGHTTLISQLSLAVGEYRFVSIAGYNEIPMNMGQIDFDETVRLYFNTGGGYGSLHVGMPPPDKAAPAILTIEASALECRTERNQYRLWVDQGRRLMMESLN